MRGGGDVQEGVLVWTAAVEAVEADVEAGGRVDAVEALGAVFAVDGLRGERRT